jgi:protein-tyrosine phosphatase
VDSAVAGRFQARQLDPSMIKGADLVLGMSPLHRAAVVECDSTALRTAFCLREFARLVGAADPATLPVPRGADARARGAGPVYLRGVVAPVDPDLDRVPGPIGRPRRAHRHAARTIHQAVSVVVGVIAPPR